MARPSTNTARFDDCWPFCNKHCHCWSRIIRRVHSPLRLRLPVSVALVVPLLLLPRWMLFERLLLALLLLEPIIKNNKNNNSICLLPAHLRLTPSHSSRRTIVQTVTPGERHGEREKREKRKERREKREVKRENSAAKESEAGGSLTSASVPRSQVQH